MDIEALRQAYAKSPVLKAILDYSADRKKNSSEISADRIEALLGRENPFVDRRNVIQAFKELADLGLGEFIVGRRKFPTRFKWRVQMVEAGRSARGEGNAVPLLEASEAVAEEQIVDRPRGLTVRHRFNLRPDYAVDIELPQDFTEREASRLAEFIRTLPFEAS
jgi:hypothetical protein